MTFNIKEYILLNLVMFVELYYVFMLHAKYNDLVMSYFLSINPKLFLNSSVIAI